jgi:hypothetical protein
MMHLPRADVLTNRKMVASADDVGIPSSQLSEIDGSGCLR